MSKSSLWKTIKYTQFWTANATKSTVLQVTQVRNAHRTSVLMYTAPSDRKVPNTPRTRKTYSPPTIFKKVSPPTAPKKVSPPTTPKTVSPPTTPKTVSPPTTPKTASPQTTPKTSSPSPTPKTVSTLTTPKTASPPNTPKTTSPSTNPETANPPENSLKIASPPENSPKTVSPPENSPKTDSPPDNSPKAISLPENSPKTASPPENSPKLSPPPGPRASTNWSVGRLVNQLDVADKVAIIAGGCTGLCYATASELLQQDAKRVVLTGSEPSDGADALALLKRDLGAERASCAEFAPLDVTNSVQFEKVFSRTLYKYQRVDMLFNVAAMMDDSRWEHEVDTNINGLVRGVLLAFRYMGRRNARLPAPAPALAPAAGLPVVVNVACVAGLDPLAGAPIYSLTQSAAAALTRCFGAPFHVQRTGVRVVCLYSGITSENVLLDEDELLRLRLLDWEWSRAAQKQIKAMPVQEAGAVARAALFLARNGSSGSVWLVENSELRQLIFPPHSNMAQRTTSCK